VCPGGVPVPLHSRALMDLAMNSSLAHNLQRADKLQDGPSTKQYLHIFNYTLEIIETK
jgi:hypothetical protein